MQELLNLYIETFGLGFSRPLLGQKLPNHIINKPRKWYFSEIILIKNNINMKKHLSEWRLGPALSVSHKCSRPERFLIPRLPQVCSD